LPRGWKSSRSSTLRRLGDRWVERGARVALIVPSAVVEEETNVLLNPAHADMARIKIGGPTAFSFDARMFEQRRSARGER
jgi:RES domain-containing protein